MSPNEVEIIRITRNFAFGLPGWTVEYTDTRWPSELFVDYVTAQDEVGAIAKFYQWKEAEYARCRSNERKRAGS